MENRDTALTQHHNQCAYNRIQLRERLEEDTAQLNLVVFQAEKDKVISGKEIDAN